MRSHETYKITYKSQALSALGTYIIATPGLTERYSSSRKVTARNELSTTFIPPTPGVYFPAIDALRGIAVLFVLFHHVFRTEKANLLALGNIGVDIFFTLSGFLITGILLSYKDSLPLQAALKKFYWRRTLRIFPIYYLYILIAYFLFRELFSTEALISTVFYYANFHMIAFGHLSWPVSHFWSLAVEEQFYLFWPLFILMTPQKFLRPLITSVVVGSILFTLINSLIFKADYVNYVHLLSCISSLGIGALLALMQKKHSERLTWFRRHNTILIVLFALISVICIAGNQNGIPLLFDFLRPANAALAFCLLVRATSMKLSGAWSVLKSQKLQWIGRISYGIYVYHILVLIIFEPYLSKVLQGWEYNVVAMPFYTAITILISYISFEVFEKRILMFKDRIPQFNTPLSHKNY